MRHSIAVRPVRCPRRPAGSSDCGFRGSGGGEARRPDNTTEGTTVEIPKDKVLELLQQQGKSDQAEQARQELPDQVDPERDSGLLAKFGIDPQDLLGKLGGGIPGL